MPSGLTLSCGYSELPHLCLVAAGGCRLATVVAAEAYVVDPVSRHACGSGWLGTVHWLCGVPSLHAAVSPLLCIQKLEEHMTNDASTLKKTSQHRS